MNIPIHIKKQLKKPIDVNSSTHIDFGVENKDKDPELKVSNHVRISKYKNIFPKGCTLS